MDPPPTSFSGRRRSSVVDPNVPPTSIPSTTPTPRKASTWDSPAAESVAPTASDISKRRSSETPEASASGNPDADSITARKASAWDDEGASPMSGTRASVSDIAKRRATATDRPPWDPFCGAPPGYEDSSWGWMSEISTIMTSGTTSSERSRVFYDGNINYISENYDDANLAITDIEALMYSYGVEKTSAEDILNKIDPQKSGSFSINPQNKQFLMASNIKFSPPNEPLSNLRHASKCYQQKFLSPIHFAGYIIDVLKERFMGNEPRFMILGMYSIFGVLEGPSKRKLTTKDVEKFTRLWRVTNADEVQDLIDVVQDDHNGTSSCWALYNMLYRRNAFGKQRIQVFDTMGQKNPSLFFPLMDKDGDGFLGPADLRSFAAIFGQDPSNEASDRVTRKLDLDGDGKISLEDYRGVMAPIFEGMTWEFWLVVILLTLEL